MVDGIVTEPCDRAANGLPMYIAAGSEVPPPQNELFAIASEDRGFLSTIDVGILTLC
jgi:hypothetical protein